MKLKYSLIAIALGITSYAGAQIPKFKNIPSNEEKQYEYKADAEVDRAGSGDLLERIDFWAKNSLGENAKAHAYKDEADKNILHVDVEVQLPEAHFSVSRVHKNRKLNYSITFNCDKKEYTYTINQIKYSALESYKKGDIQIDGLLSEMKSPTKLSVEEEINLYFQGIIESFSDYANTDIEDLKNPKVVEESDEEVEEGTDETPAEEVQEEEEAPVAPKLHEKKDTKSKKDE